MIQLVFGLVLLFAWYFSSARAQAAYVKQRYGSWDKAQSFWKAHHWY